MFDQLVRRLRRRGDVHAAVSVNKGRRSQVTATTSIERDEADRQTADVLPERQAMSVMQPPHMIGSPIFDLPTETTPINAVPPEEA